eukprot:6074464-Amphidinium_carterae.1
MAWTELVPALILWVTRGNLPRSREDGCQHYHVQNCLKLYTRRSFSPGRSRTLPGEQASAVSQWMLAL